MVRATQLKEQAEGGEHQGQEVRELGCCSLSWRSGAKAGSQKPRENLVLLALPGSWGLRVLSIPKCLGSLVDWGGGLGAGP